MTQIMIDSQFDEAYRSPEVIKVYVKCTKSLQGKELALQKAEGKKEVKSENEIMLETMKHNSQMVFQVGEMLKEMNIAKQAERRGYQPIVRTIGSQPNHTSMVGQVKEGYRRLVYGGPARPWRRSSAIHVEVSDIESINVVHKKKLSDDELGLVRETDPEGMVTMAARLINAVKQGVKEEKWQQMSAYVDSLTEEERTRSVAMADNGSRMDRKCPFTTEG
ncbi:hypothetical protein EV426DRAFT_706543 [Tirmania nivea]|nr:hypothetical protein EV426DRAFT_706543 [Tirmania nivea]